MEEKIASIIARYPSRDREYLIPVLQEIHNSEGYLSDAAIGVISEQMMIPKSKIYSVATFYNQFLFKPCGKHTIRICRGTNCHMEGSAHIMDRICEHLDIHPGDTTKDGMFTLHPVSCMGSCENSPVVSIDDDHYTVTDAETVKGIIKGYYKQAT